MQIITNYKPRDIVGGHMLTARERAEFDYMDDVNDGSFFRYRGAIYDIGEFMRISGTDSPFKEWHGYAGDSYFSGVLIRLSSDGDSVIIGRYYS